MRIISTFHDYYDILNDGSDKDHVWKRKTHSFLPNMNDPFYKVDNWENSLPHLMDYVDIPKKGAVYDSSGCLWRRGMSEEYRRALLLFCGKFHPFVRVNDRICWDFASFAEAIDLEERPFFKREHSFFSRKYVLAACQAMFTQEKILPRFKTLNLRLKCPIVLLDMEELDLGPVREHEPERFCVRITLNPCLAELNFASQIPPLDAFQKLEGYLFNELAMQNDPPLEVNDTILRDSHGFDKFSFRKPPSKKRK